MGLLDRLDAAVAAAPKNSRVGQAAWRRGVAPSQELERIKALPRRPLDPSTFPDLTPLYLHTPVCAVRGCDLCSDGPARMWPLQSLALLEAEQLGGAMLGLPVGEGKTLLSLLLPDALRAVRAALFVPAGVIDQLVNEDIPRYGRHFRLPMDRLRVFAYTELSNRKIERVSTEEAAERLASGLWREAEGQEDVPPGQREVVQIDPLELYDPDTVIADEGHSLRHFSAARTKLMRAHIRRRPVKFAPLSGTLTTDKITDYAHLSDWSLGLGSPVPLGFKELSDWGSSLDADPLEAMPPGALLDLCTEEERGKVERKELDATTAAREGFCRRLTETPGVVLLPGRELKASLLVRKRTVAVPSDVIDTIRDLERTWSIGEEEIDSAATMAGKARELACGFWYRWDWPGGIVDHEWLEARSAWAKSVRDVLKQSRPGLESPAHVEAAARRGALPRHAKEWKAWTEVMDRPAPPSVPVWISPYLVEDAMRWAQKEIGIVWFGHTAVEDELRMRLDPALIYGGGESARLVAFAAGPEAGKRTIYCSINAHHFGKNLQAWSRALVMSWPANGAIVEQLLGREHRQGQKADEVVYETYLHTAATRGAWDSAMIDAHYVLETTRQRQRILLARRMV